MSVPRTTAGAGLPLPVMHARGRAWEGFAVLYRALIPRAEREPLETIRRRIEAGRYLLSVLSTGDRIAGFSLVDAVSEPAYGMLTYLGVSEEHRGSGLGRRLAEHALGRFRSRGVAGLPFVEARDERAAHLYRRCGFRPLAMAYRVPLYGSEAATVPMRLMAADGRGAVSGEYLRRVIAHVFVDGYGLPHGDPRLEAQLARVPDEVTMTRSIC